MYPEWSRCPLIEMSQRRGSTVDCKSERHWRKLSEFCFHHIIQYNCNNALDASDYDLLILLLAKASCTWWFLAHNEGTEVSNPNPVILSVFLLIK